jgi:hypothetical protein
MDDQPNDTFLFCSLNDEFSEQEYVSISSGNVELVSILVLSTVLDVRVPRSGALMAARTNIRRSREPSNL